MLTRNRVRSHLLSLITGFFLFFLPACSDDSPGDPADQNQPPALHTVSGQLALPADCTTDPATLSLNSSTGEATVEVDGAFAVELFDGTGQLVIATTSAGNPFLMGWVGDQHTEVSARTTAEVLVWMALGSWMLPYGEQGHSRELVCSLGGELDALEAAIEAELVDHPDGLTELSTGIRDALSATVTALLPDPALGGEKGVLIQPSEQRSGVEVLNRGGLNAITLKNSYRRRVWVSLDRIAYVDETDAEHELDEAANIFEIDPVEGFAGVVGTVGGYFTGDIAYTPVETEPIALQNVAEAKYSVYTLITGGMGSVPPDAEDALSSAELDAIEWVALKTMVWDFFVPLVMNIVSTSGQLEGADGIAGIDEDQISAVFTLLLYVKDTLPTIYRNSADGNVADALYDLWDVFTGSDEFKNLTFNLVRGLFERLGVEGGNAAYAMEEAANYLALVGWIDAVGGFMDTGAIAAHIGMSEVADRWELKVTDPQVTILPLAAFVQANAQVDTIRVNVDDDTGGEVDGSAYAYHWTCSGGFGNIVNPVHPTDTDNDFETHSDWVSYDAGAAAGLDSVFVDVYKTLGSQRIFVGRAASSVQVSVDIGVRMILRGSDDTDFDMTIQDWRIYDVAGFIETEDVFITKWRNGEYMFPMHAEILGGPDDIAVPVIVGYALMGDVIRLDFTGYPSWIGPLWFHYVGEGIHGVKQVTEGMVMPDDYFDPPWTWTTTLD